MEDDKSARPQHGAASDAVVGIWGSLGAHSASPCHPYWLARLIGRYGNAAEIAASLPGQVPLPRSPKFPLGTVLSYLVQGHLLHSTAQAHWVRYRPGSREASSVLEKPQTMSDELHARTELNVQTAPAPKR